MNFESFLEGMNRSEHAANQQLHSTANDHAAQRREQANAASKAALAKHKANQAKKKSLVHKVKKLFKFEEFIGESSSVIYGGIILLPSKKEIDWDGESFEKGIAKLGNMTSTKFRTDWKWAGDLDPSECDIYVKLNGKEHTFTGPKAVENLLKLAKQ